MSDKKNQPQKTSLEIGQDIISTHVKDLPNTAGVYRMLGEDGAVLYVGKAKSLVKRVSSYTRIKNQPERILRMVALTRSMEFVHTDTEVDALLLECNLIKELKPHYNILLRDDKSFPYILLTGDHDYPMITKHRGAKKRKGQYFGPFASAGDVNRVIGVMQRVFKLRNCTDNYFSTRKRPCLQYHIKRCTAPCMGKVSAKNYAEQVSEARDFLSGKSRSVQDRLLTLMQGASDDQDYELAAELRDRARALTTIQARQDIYIEGLEEADIIAIHKDKISGKSCVQVFFFRAGQNFGNRSYFPKHTAQDTAEQILGAFIAQFYAKRDAPKEVLISHMIEEQDFLEDAFGMKIKLPQRGERKRALDFALKNAQSSLNQHLAQHMREAKFLESVAELFAMDMDKGELPKRIEIYDNSHISGTHMVGAMVVAGAEGFIKKAYRKFNIREAAASDDCAMMREVLSRRFKRGLAEEGEDSFPDLLLIDGGAGQLSAARDALQDCGVWDRLTVVGIAKGVDRNAGRERFFIDGRKEFSLPLNDPILHYLQRLRDEAHRFAISAHRAKRAKAFTSSPLDEIAGIGAARKKALLHYFGSAKAVGEARLEEISKVDGVSKALAQKIYDHFHEV